MNRRDVNGGTSANDVYEDSDSHRVELSDMIVLLHTAQTLKVLITWINIIEPSVDSIRIYK